MTGKMSSDLLAGSWIVDAGPNQLKVLASYTAMGDGKFSSVESVLNFDWTLGGSKPNATHGTATFGEVETRDGVIRFILITYALDASGKAVYIAKSTGDKIFEDQDTIRVENMVLFVYNDPETANPVTDAPDFCIPPSGVFPPVREYRIKVNTHL